MKYKINYQQFEQLGIAAQTVINIIFFKKKYNQTTPQGFACLLLRASIFSVFILQTAPILKCVYNDSLLFNNATTKYMCNNFYIMCIPIMNFFDLPLSISMFFSWLFMPLHKLFNFQNSNLDLNSSNCNLNSLNIQMHFTTLLIYAKCSTIIINIVPNILLFFDGSLTSEIQNEFLFTCKLNASGEMQKEIKLLF